MSRDQYCETHDIDDCSDCPVSWKCPESDQYSAYGADQFQFANLDADPGL